jgi:hypothetical protein
VALDADTSFTINGKELLSNTVIDREPDAVGAAPTNLDLL